MVYLRMVRLRDRVEVNGTPTMDLNPSKAGVSELRYDDGFVRFDGVAGPVIVPMSNVIWMVCQPEAKK